MITKEKVRELVDDIVHRVITRAHHSDDIDKKIAQWLEQNQPTPQVVGLSGKQLVSDYDNLLKEHEHLEKEHNLLEDTHFHLKAAYADLEAQQDTVNWDDAPENAKWLTISHLWSDENHKRIHTTIMSEHKRPKPAPPLIEEGQTWELLHDEYGMTVSIIAVGDMSINGIYADSVTFMLNRKPRTLQTETFLSKFARVP